MNFSRTVTSPNSRSLVSGGISLPAPSARVFGSQIRSLLSSGFWSLYFGRGSFLRTSTKPCSASIVIAACARRREMPQWLYTAKALQLVVLLSPKVPRAIARKAMAGFMPSWQACLNWGRPMAKNLPFIPYLPVQEVVYKLIGLGLELVFAVTHCPAVPILAQEFVSSNMEPRASQARD